MALKSAIKVAHPNIFTFIDAIKKEQKNNELKLIQIESGGVVAKQKAVDARTEKRIQQLLQLYGSNLLSVPDFLDRTGASF